MWQYGGIYMDTDTITLKSFAPLIEMKKNGFGYLYEYEDSLSNSFLIFTQKLHPYLKYLIDAFVADYNETDWAINGHELINKTILEYCQVPTYLSLEYVGFKPAAFSYNRTHQCTDLVLFPESFFFPFTCSRADHKQIFEANTKHDRVLDDKTRQSFSFHYFNKITKELTARVDDGSFFTEKLKQNCKFTFEYLKMSGKRKF